MNSHLSILAACALAAAVLVPSASAAILYRGRLTRDVTSTTQFDAGASYTMTFRIYAQPQGGEPLCTVVTNAVPVGRDGGFEVLLEGKDVDSAVDNDNRTVYLGLALDEERELIPRRQVLALPRVVRADSADKPGHSPHFGQLTAGGLSARTVTVDEIDVSGTLTTQSDNDALSIRGLDLQKGQSLDVSGRRISVFGDVTQLTNGVTKVAAGTPIATAPADGLAYISGQSATAAPKVGGITRFCRRGEAILAPVDVPSTETLSVRFYSFLAR